MLGSTSKPILEGTIYTGCLNHEELIDWITDMEKFFYYEEMEEGKRVKFVVTNFLRTCNTLVGWSAGRKKKTW